MTMTRRMLPVSLSALFAVGCASDVQPTTSTTDKVGAATAASTTPASGPMGRRGHHRLDPAGHAKKLQAKLGLTDEQTQKVMAIFTEMVTKGGERPKDPAGRAAFRQQLRERLKTVMTPQQLTAFEQLMKNKMGGHAGMHGKLDPAERAKKLQAKLGLTDAQLAQVTPVLADMGPKMMQVKRQLMAHHHGEAALAPEPLKALQAQKAELNKQRDTRLQAIFTAEQWTRYQKMLDSHGDCNCGGGCDHGHKGPHGAAKASPTAPAAPTDETPPATK